ncbi:MAG: hypothetical protein B6U97_02215 [Candidatus Altiarchaeales archaeon ex4484_96]|nr:MAG: hypothetical protein B6U97_02215 [Candidatus Altiarchaeales archaeon ex4484_96]
MREGHLSAVDKLILNVLDKSKRPLSTYQIGKRTKVSWSTANTHCYKLKALGKVDMEVVNNHLGQSKMLWRIIKP